MHTNIQKNIDQLCYFLTQLSQNQQQPPIPNLPSKIVSEIVRSSLQFQEIYNDDSEDDYIECNPKDYNIQINQERQPLVTFTQLLNELAKQPKQVVQHNRQPSAKVTVHPKHQRGPSRIKDILMSLRAGIVTDLQKIADELLNEPLLHQQFDEQNSATKQNLYKTLGDTLDEESHELRNPPKCQPQVDYLDDQIKEESIEIQTSQYSSRNQDEFESQQKNNRQIKDFSEMLYQSKQNQFENSKCEYFGKNNSQQTQKDEIVQMNKSQSVKNYQNQQKTKTLSSSSSTKNFDYGLSQEYPKQSQKFQMLQDIINGQNTSFPEQNDYKYFSAAPQTIINDSLDNMQDPSSQSLNNFKYTTPITKQSFKQQSSSNEKQDSNQTDYFNKLQDSKQKSMKNKEFLNQDTVKEQKKDIERKLQRSFKQQLQLDKEQNSSNNPFEQQLKLQNSTSNQSLCQNQERSYDQKNCQDQYQQNSQIFSRENAFVNLSRNEYKQQNRIDDYFGNKLISNQKSSQDKNNQLTENNNFHDTQLDGYPYFSKKSSDGQLFELPTCQRSYQNEDFISLNGEVKKLSDNNLDNQTTIKNGSSSKKYIDLNENKRISQKNNELIMQIKSKSPLNQSSKSPIQRACQSPNKQSSKSPLKQSGKSPKKILGETLINDKLNNQPLTEQQQFSNKFDKQEQLNNENNFTKQRSFKNKLENQENEEGSTKLFNQKSLKIRGNKSIDENNQNEQGLQKMFTPDGSNQDEQCGNQSKKENLEPSQIMQEYQEQLEKLMKYQQLQLEIPKKSKSSRKKSRIPKKLHYNLDIIEEQSFEQFTPDKHEEDDDLESQVQSLPCFVALQEHLPQFHSNGDMKQELKHTRKYIKQLDNIDIDDDLSAFQTPDYEEAILASWNRLCQEIIRKNLLPITLNLERKLQMQQQVETSNRVNIFQKLKNRRKWQHFQQQKRNDYSLGSDADASVNMMSTPNSQKLSDSKRSCENAEETNLKFSPNFSDVCKKIQFEEGKPKTISFLQYKQKCID